MRQTVPALKSRPLNRPGTQRVRGEQAQRWEGIAHDQTASQEASQEENPGFHGTALPLSSPRSSHGADSVT